jgi:hypothetical protein
MQCNAITSYESIDFDTQAYKYTYILNEDGHRINFELYVKVYLNLKFVALFYLTKKKCAIRFKNIPIFQYNNEYMTLNALISKLCAATDY